MVLDDAQKKEVGELFKNSLKEAMKEFQSEQAEAEAKAAVEAENKKKEEDAKKEKENSGGLSIFGYLLGQR